MIELPTVTLCEPAAELLRLVRILSRRLRENAETMPTVDANDIRADALVDARTHAEDCAAYLQIAYDVPELRQHGLIPFGWPVGSMARMIGRSERSVQDLCSKNGISPRPGRKVIRPTDALRLATAIGLTNTPEPDNLRAAIPRRAAYALNAINGLFAHAESFADPITAATVLVHCEQIRSLLRMRFARPERWNLPPDRCGFGSAALCELTGSADCTVQRAANHHGLSARASPLLVTPSRVGDVLARLHRHVGRPRGGKDHGGPTQNRQTGYHSR